MSDIDFDELDKAVNNLMKESTVGTTAVVAPDTPSSGQPAEMVDSQLSVEAVAESVAPVVAQPPSPSRVSESSAAAPIVRRRGQFMDIVAPQSSKRPTPPVNRQSVTIQPTTSDITPEALAPQPEDTTAVTQQTVVDVEPKENTATDSLPDPIDFGSTSHDKDNDVSTDDVPATEEVSLEPVPTADEPADAPLTSPFLPDAKVEKRPLGTPSTLTLDTLGSELAKEKTEVAEDDQSPGQSPSQQHVPLPAELHPELAGLEAESTVETPAVDTTDETKAPVTEVSVAPTAKDPAQSTPVVSGPSSIPQQYEEKQSTTDEHNGSIFDTSEYHQPLQHPEKKRSGVWIVILIMASILLGAAGAAVYYYLNMMR